MSLLTSYRARSQGRDVVKGEDARVGNGLFVLVMNVASFRGFPGIQRGDRTFYSNISNRRSDAAGVDTIRVPGERGWEDTTQTGTGRHSNRCRDLGTNSRH